MSIENFFYRKSLCCFIQRTFYIVNQGIKYQHNWHIDAISEALNCVYKGSIKKLIINIPPRYLKSFCVSVAFPAWVLGNNPKKRIIVASYSEKLALKHSMDCRFIIKSSFFKKLFPNCILSKNQNEKYKFLTDKNGYRFATSVGGTLTGEGGDILIIDDPHNPQNVLSNKYRQKTLDWYSNTFISRLDDKKNGAIIIVMQRLHPNDLTGYLLNKSSDWSILNLPIFFENSVSINVGKFHKNILENTYLFEEREGKIEIEKIKNDMGIYNFNAQYKQRPVVIEGNIFKKSWLKYYNEKIDFKNVYLSFDTAIKIGTNTDSTACTVWGEYSNNYYLIDVLKKKLEYPELKKESRILMEKYRPVAVLIEDKASGQSLIQDLKKEVNYNIIPIKAVKDKITRFATITPFFESGRVFIFENDNWLFEYEYELLSFPNVEHDDQVDSTSQFFNWINGKKLPADRSFIRRF